MATTPDKILVLLRAAMTTGNFECPDCHSFVAYLEAVEVADLTDPDTYALSAVVGQREDDFLGVRLDHHGRLGTGYCRRKFYFWDINQEVVKITPVVSIGRPYAATI